MMMPESESDQADDPLSLLLQDQPNLKVQEEDCVEEDIFSELCDEINTLN